MLNTTLISAVDGFLQTATNNAELVILLIAIWYIIGLVIASIVWYRAFEFEIQEVAVIICAAFSGPILLLALLFIKTEKHYDDLD